MFFYGSGHGFAVEECSLVMRLKEAFNLVGGLQQVPPCTTPYDRWKEWENENADGWEEVRDLVRDIAMALLGEKITFEDEDA